MHKTFSNQHHKFSCTHPFVKYTHYKFIMRKKVQNKMKAQATGLMTTATVYTPNASIETTFKSIFLAIVHKQPTH